MFRFENLDQTSRKYMLESIEEAESSEDIYYSTRFNEAGRKNWVPLLKVATLEHDEHWLAYQLEIGDMMKGLESARKPSGGYTTKHVPDTAAGTMAEGQFNRFYILGLCRRARSEGTQNLIVYRARESADPRKESEDLVGKSLSIDEVEAQLKDIGASFKSPLVKPNSGISVRLP